MIEGFDLASRDIGGFSDPYLILKLGRQKKDDRKNYILDEPAPKFMKYFDFETTFPGFQETTFWAIKQQFNFRPPEAAF